MRLKNVIGAVDEFSLSSRIFHTMCLVLSIAGFFSSLLNIFIHLPLVAVLLAVFITIFPCILLYISRYKRKGRLARSLFLLSAYFVTSGLWFFNAGVNGTVHFILLSIIVYQLIIAFRNSYFWFFVNISIYLILTAVSIYLPQITIYEYDSLTSKHLDFVFTYIIVAASLFFITRIFREAYLNEKKMVAQKASELELLNKELQQKNEQLSRVNQTKAKLFSVISHDLKNAIGGITNLSSIMIEYKDRYTKEKTNEFVQLINSSAKNTGDMLVNLLAWAKLQMDSMAVQPEKCDILHWVQLNLVIFQLSILQKNQTVNVAIHEGTFVWADNNMVDSIIRNILSNAIKFTPVNGIIYIYSSLSDDKKFVLLTIEDTGVGMTEEELANLQNDGTIFSKNGTADEKGTGLGFVLSKEFALINKGAITVSSQLGKGSIFTVQLPVA